MKFKSDVDIDLGDRVAALRFLPHIPAMMTSKGTEQAHNTGVYFQNIPTNPLTNLASIQYKQAEELGYFKVDFLNNTVYQGVRDEAHLTELMNREPLWDLLKDPDFVSLLAHVHEHFDIVDVIQPKSVEDLAVVIALIRPGKRHLLHLPRNEIDADIWNIPNDGSYCFKKAHSYAYAVSIVVQMNLLVEQMQNV